MSAIDLEDNDWVDDVQDLDFFDDDDDDWDLDDLIANPQNEAQRIYFDNVVAREERTEEEIEALGIRPDVPSIVLHMTRWEEEARSVVANGRIIPTVSNLSDRVQLVYHGRPKEFAFSDEEESEDEAAVLGKNEEEFEATWESQLIEHGLENNNPLLQREYRAIARERFLSLKQSIKTWQKAQRAPKRPKPTIDLLSTLCTTPELLIEVCKHLRPKDLVNLHALHRGFHNTLNHNMRKFVFAWSRHMAPVASRIYSSPVYAHWFIPDPLGRKCTRSDHEISLPRPGQACLGEDDMHVNCDGSKTRLVPGLLWLQHVVQREVRVRDVLAVLARHGHRTLPETDATLQKIWLVLECPTNRMRLTLFCNESFLTDDDLYRFQLFFVKLVLLFNDPVFGPGSTVLARLFMGQRGLSPLWKFLRRKGYTTEAGIHQLKLRYDVPPKNREIWSGEPVMGVQIYDMGVGQFEGWERGGTEILMRPEELVVMEGGRRGLGAMCGWECLFGMMTYGHVDYETGDNLVPSLEEMYMSDEDEEEKTGLERVAGLHENEIVNGECGNVPFERGMWQPKHARKVRWKELTDEEREEMIKEEEKEMARKERVNKGMDMYRLARRKLEDMYNITAMGFKGKEFKIKVPDPKVDWKEETAEIHRQVLFRMKAAMAAATVVSSDESESPPRATKLPRLEDVGVVNDQVVEAAPGNMDDDRDTNMDQDMAESVDKDMDVEMEIIDPDHNTGEDEGYDAESEEFDDEGWEEFEDDKMEIDSPPFTVVLRPAPPPPPPPPPPPSPPPPPPPPSLADVINHDNHLDTIWSSPPTLPPNPASFNALPISEQYPILFGPELPSSQNLSLSRRPRHQSSDHSPPPRTAPLGSLQHHPPPTLPPRRQLLLRPRLQRLRTRDHPHPPEEISTFMSGQYMTPPPTLRLGLIRHPLLASPLSSSSSEPPPRHPLPQPQPEQPPTPLPRIAPLDPSAPHPLPDFHLSPPFPIQPPSPPTRTSQLSTHTSPTTPYLQPLESMSVPEAEQSIAQVEDEDLMALADIQYDSATEADVNDPDGGVDWEHYVNNLDMYRSGPGQSWCLQRVPVHPDWAEEQRKEEEYTRERERIKSRLDEIKPDLWRDWTEGALGEHCRLGAELGRLEAERQGREQPPRDEQQVEWEEQEKSMIHGRMGQLRRELYGEDGATEEHERLVGELMRLEEGWRHEWDGERELGGDVELQRQQSTTTTTQGQPSTSPSQQSSKQKTSTQGQQQPRIQLQHPPHGTLLPNMETIRRQRWPSPTNDFWESPRVRKARDWYSPW
ncbi:hypothetical protein QC764_211380 [Podospora pseudoanserina]|uniref:F-box domain-containing protein n=1 Tax=Podospora pseudoanserina TaxID=2609844 RepID=A0ABR0IIQ8_9PEZI|nr:hypothetical protein QC764_211380 [Podospora pseudoanserina]